MECGVRTWKNWRSTIALAAIVVLLLPAWAEDDVEAGRVLSVGAQHVERAAATRARITGLIEAEAASAAAAQQAVVGPSRAVLEFLQREDVEDVQAGALALDPIYAPPSSEEALHRPPPPLNQRIAAYRARWSVNFEIPAEQAGEVVAGLVNAGVTRIARFEFTASEEAIAEARNRALQAAARKARAQAQTVLEALGYEAGDVVGITLDGGGPVVPLHRERMMTMDAGPAAADTAVEPGFIEVDAAVSMKVAY